MKRKNFLIAGFSVLVLVGVSACGGGSSGGSNDEETPVVSTDSEDTSGDEVAVGGPGDSEDTNDDGDDATADNPVAGGGDTSSLINLREFIFPAVSSSYNSIEFEFTNGERIAEFVIPGRDELDGDSLVVFEDGEVSFTVELVGSELVFDPDLPDNEVFPVQVAVGQSLVRELDANLFTGAEIDSLTFTTVHQSFGIEVPGETPVIFSDVLQIDNEIVDVDSGLVDRSISYFARSIGFIGFEDIDCIVNDDISDDSTTCDSIDEIYSVRQQ